MHPYIPHLLADIANAHRTEISEEIFPQTIEEYFEEVDRFIEGEEPAHTFGYHCGLESINFPPPEQLTNQDMQMVSEAFQKMLVSWNLNIHFPENLPVEMAYRIAVEFLDEKTDVPNSGTMNLDFCSGYAPDCIFKEYCSCLECWDNPDDIDDFSFSDDDKDVKQNSGPLKDGEEPSNDDEDDLPF